MEFLEELCHRVKKEGSGALTEEEKELILTLGESSGYSYRHPNIQAYCVDFLLNIISNDKDVCEFNDMSVDGCVLDEDGDIIDDLTQEKVKSLVRFKCNRQIRCWDLKSLEHVLQTSDRDPLTNTRFPEAFVNDAYKLVSNNKKDMSPMDVRIVTNAKRQFQKELRPLKEYLDYNQHAFDNETHQALRTRVDLLEKEVNDILDVPLGRDMSCFNVEQALSTFNELLPQLKEEIFIE